MVTSSKRGTLSSLIGFVCLHEAKIKNFGICVYTKQVSDFLQEWSLVTNKKGLFWTFEALTNQQGQHLLS